MTRALHDTARAGRLPVRLAPTRFEEVAPEDMAEWQSADWKAAAMVAGLMVSIFTLGITMYLFIAFCAMTGPP